MIMTQEDKELLIKDLCARLPYGVKLKKNYGDNTTVELYGIDVDKNTINICEFKGKSITVCDNNIPLFLAMVKSRYLPYLFPLSSMTAEQKKEYDKIIYKSIELHHREYSDIVEIDLFDNLQDFYCKNHLDYRGLIEKGLAIDATDKNIY